MKKKEPTLHTWETVTTDVKAVGYVRPATGERPPFTRAAVLFHMPTKRYVEVVQHVDGKTSRSLGWELVEENAPPSATWEELSPVSFEPDRSFFVLGADELLDLRSRTWKNALVRELVQWMDSCVSAHPSFPWLMHGSALDMSTRWALYLESFEQHHVLRALAAVARGQVFEGARTLVAVEGPCRRLARLGVSDADIALASVRADEGGLCTTAELLCDGALGVSRGLGVDRAERRHLLRRARMRLSLQRASERQESAR